MAVVKVSFNRSSVGSLASFEGVVDPNGPTGYTFSGTLKAVCRLDRSREDFQNTVRLGHGGTSGEYAYLQMPIADSGENVVTVKGEGTRAANETVDFRVGVNDGLSGQFDDGDKASVTVGGPPKHISPSYLDKDSLGNTQYDVRFDGHAWADGPTGYLIRGTLTGYDGPGAATTQYATFGYKSRSGSWQYKTYSCDDTPAEFTIRAQRKNGEDIQVVVGATSAVFNLYKYGNEVNCALPASF